MDYFHVVFTLPHKLNPIAVHRPRLVYRVLFQAASETLLEFARDGRHLGAEPAIIAVLHTWGQNLSLHVHLHCIITAGGLDATQRRWIRRSGGFLFPVRALSRAFRGKYLDILRRSLRRDSEATSGIPFADLWHQDWVVYAKKPFGGPRQVLDYLARYTHRVALTNDRLLDHSRGIVRLRWRDHVHGGKRKVLNLKATDLLGRFVLHVLPQGFHRIRHYGLLGNRHKSAKLAAARSYFGIAVPRTPKCGTAAATNLLQRLGIEPDRCAACGSLRLSREPLLPTTQLPRARAPTGKR